MINKSNGRRGPRSYRPRFTITRSTVRSIGRAATYALSISLIVVILATQAPALPSTVRQLFSESRNSFKFWAYSSGWAKTARGLTAGQIGAGSAAQPESQADRDSLVASIRAFPGDVTMKMGERVFLNAVAFDAKGQPAGGIKFAWRAEMLESLKIVRISQTGEFVAPAPGSYRVTVEGARTTAQLIVTVLQDENRPANGAKPISVKEVSSRDPIQSTPAPKQAQQPVAPNVAEEPGGGWDGGNFPAADDPENDRGNPPGRPLHHDAGSGNFQMSAPVLSLPGRGIDVSLALTYNSRMWTLSNSDITYDIDRDWPAAGWSLGFGRVAGLGVGGAMLIDADGTRHGFTGTVTQFAGGYISFTGHTIDGTFIDYNTFTDNTGIINYAQVSLPNGTVIQYGAPGRGAVHPQRITDASGNYITVEYRFNPERGPKIQRVTDTLGRVINFYYEGPKLTAITAPGLDGIERQLVRLHYKTLTLNYGFSPTLTSHVDNPAPDALDAIYYPGTGTGYWFGDSDSYSSYGMLAKYSEQRAMGFSAASLEVQGTVTAGTITSQCAYNYTLTPDASLSDAPTYTTQTETWDGMDTAAAVTQYLLQRNATTRSATVTFPDLTKSVQLSYKAPEQFNDGYIYEDDTYDSNGVLLRKSTVTWAMGDYSSARPSRLEATDERNQMTAAEFDYASTPSYNQVTTVRDFDYGGANRLRTTRMTYRNGVEFTGRHLFNIVKRTDIWDASDTTRMSRVEYGHDEWSLANTPNVTQHDPGYDPYQPPECYWDPEFGEICTPVYNPATAYRGNVTTVTRYTNAASVTGAIAETRNYDITGNMVIASTSCCEQTSLAYSLNTQYLFPDSLTRGSADPQSPARVTTSAIYNFNTGLTRFTTDANGRQAEAAYVTATLRPQTLTMPTGGYTNYAYDDGAMSVTETVSLFGGTVASQNIKRLNGLGLVKREEALGQSGAWDYVDMKFDVVGRLWQQTRPYRLGQTPQWTEGFYDALGRVYRVLPPDGSELRTYFNEPTRPGAASILPGQTARAVDAWGRERWARLDANGRLTEVVEPNPTGTGSVFGTGSLATSYSFDTLGNLTQVNQGVQQRKFRYDSLSRVTQQKLAEESATLNDLGQYVGSGAWSQTFAYDDRSNLIGQTDARGIKTVNSYNGDPLNRLQSVSYDISGFGDTAHPILPAASLAYEYMSSGDKTRLFKVTTAGVNTDEYGYDGESRVGSRTLTMTSRPSYPMVTEYIYDTLDRVMDVRYPAQYGVAGNPRKVAHQDYDVASRMTGLKVDGVDYASQIAYNPASQTTSLKVGTSGIDQITESYSYDDMTGLLASQKVERGASTLLDLSYDYLKAGTTGGRTGQLAKILNNLNHNRDRGYEYDALGRLTRATGGQFASWTQNYVYDRYGNRTSVSASGTTSSGSPASPLAPAPNQPPVVSITSPASGATFTAPGTVTINATATDPDGTISKVEFYQGATLLNTDTKAAYSFTWSNVPAGSYTLTAKAYDNLGATTTSTAVNITVNAGGNNFPAVSITSPASGATFTAPVNITINASASDSDGSVTQVQFFNGASLLGTSTIAPYSFNWNSVGAGSYSLTAKATDNLGATTTSSAVNITVNTAANNPPAVNITAPANGAAFTAPANITINASASDSDGSVAQVQFFQGATLLGTDTAAPYSFAWNSVGAGSYSLTATATDNLGATTTSSAVNITVSSGGNNPPATSITLPANGASFTAPASVQIKANATDTDGTITQVQFFQGAALLGTDTIAPYSITWTGVGAGSYSLTARATDNLGATTTSTAVNITVTGAANNPPAVSITSPANGATFTAPANITINANASDSDGSVTQVQFFQGATLLGTDTTSPYSFTWNSVGAGGYSLTARATDNLGATTTSGAVSITVNGAGNNPPAASITSPANGATFVAPANITINASASDSDGSVTQVQFFQGAALLGTDTTAPYSFTWNGVGTGSYSLTAKATDNGGATTTSSAVSITVNPAGNNPPAVSITSPANGATFTAPANITINASASDSDGSVAQVQFFQGATLLGTDTSAPYSFSWNSVAAGSYSLTAKATDNSGAATTSSAVAITVSGGASAVPGDGLANVSYDQATNRINTLGWEYDAAGNQTRLQRADLSWQRHVYDAAGRLVKVQNDVSQTQIINTYGASNHRLTEQIGDESSNQRTYYAWAGDSVIAEYEETAGAPTTPRWVKSYVYLGGRLLATLAPNGASERVEYHHPDRLGTRLVSNNQDTTTFEQASLPFGTALDAESSGATKRRFTSYDRSAVSGLDYAVNRHYDPLQGRFTQVDPIGMNSTTLSNPQTLNLFAYCINDPINHTDPSGLGFFSFLLKVFKFFAAVAKWVAIVVAVAVLIAVAFPAFAPILGTILFDLGIWQLGAGVSASFLSAGVAGGIGLGATSYILGGLAAAGAVNSFLGKKQSKRAPKRKKASTGERPCPADKARFFKWLVGPLTKMALDLDTTLPLMLTQAAKEGGWNDEALNHNQPINNPFGVNRIGGGRAIGNRHYGSLDEAIADWERQYAGRVFGTRTPEAFGHGMQHPAQGQPYNSNPNYEGNYAARYADVLKWMKICNIQ